MAVLITLIKLPTSFKPEESLITLKSNFMIKVEIDKGSGFCFGVVTAIHKAEELAKGETLYCLGDIVHNSRGVDRLKGNGTNHY